MYFRFCSQIKKTSNIYFFYFFQQFPLSLSFSNSTPIFYFTFLFNRSRFIHKCFSNSYQSNWEKNPNFDEQKQKSWVMQIASPSIVEVVNQSQAKENILAITIQTFYSSEYYRCFMIYSFATYLNFVFHKYLFYQACKLKIMKRKKLQTKLEFIVQLIL